MPHLEEFLGPPGHLYTETHLGTWMATCILSPSYLYPAAVAAFLKWSK